MENIITDFEKLSIPSEPLTFLSEEGIKSDECNEIIAKLKETLASDESLLGISAPQIGINKRIFCLRFNDVIKTFINPIITKKQGIKIVVETCASLPGKEIVIARPEEITCVYYNDTFNYEDNKLVGAAASMFDQQAQLLDGVLPSSLGLVSDIEQDGKIEESDLESIVTFYKETFLPTRLESLMSVISLDDEAKKNYNYLKFTEGVINGRNAVLEPEAEIDRRRMAKKAVNKSLTHAALANKASKKVSFNNYVKSISKKAH